MDFPSGNGVVRGRRGQQLGFALDCRTLSCKANPSCCPPRRVLVQRARARAHTLRLYTPPSCVANMGAECVRMCVPCTHTRLSPVCCCATMLRHHQTKCPSDPNYFVMDIAAQNVRRQIGHKQPGLTAVDTFGVTNA